MQNKTKLNINKNKNNSRMIKSKSRKKKMIKIINFKMNKIKIMNTMKEEEIFLIELNALSVEENLLLIDQKNIKMLAKKVQLKKDLFLIP